MLTLAPLHQVEQPHSRRHGNVIVVPWSHTTSEQPFLPPNVNRQSLDHPASSGMTTSHRGLPPPTSFGETYRSQQPPPPQSHSSAHGYAPIPPQPQQQQPQAAFTPTLRPEDDATREGYWLARAEEHKRYQEEEKTRQQQLRLEQRKVEHDMLREALRGGVPPHIVPSIFVSIGGGGSIINPAQPFPTAMQPAQHEYVTSAHPARPSPPELRRETRPIPQQQPAVYYPAPGSAIPPSAAAHQPPPPLFNPPTAYPAPVRSPRSHRASTMTGHPPEAPVLKHASTSSLPRLTTNEAQVQQPTGGSLAYGSERASPSPSISFHHWQPPATTSGGSRGQKEEGHKTSPRQGTNFSDTGAVNSPRKRKDPRPHQPAPAPGYFPRERSPMSERPASVHGRPSHHARHSSAGAFRARAYDPIGRSSDRPQTTPRNQSDDSSDPRKPIPSEQGSIRAPDSGKTDTSKSMT